MKKGNPTVWVIDNDLERALRVFRWQMNQAGILKALRYRRQCAKPSDRKKVKRMFAERRRIKQELRR